MAVAHGIASGDAPDYDLGERETLGRGRTMMLYAPPIATLAFVLGMLLSLMQQAGGF
jgi:hypothetical protein